MSSWKRKDLSPEERDEYDAIMAEAGYDDDGQRRPSGEIGPRMRELLEDALQAGRPWAQYILDDDTEYGHLTRFKRWDKDRNQQKVFVGDTVVQRAAVVGVKRKLDGDTREWQQSLWRELTWDEIEQKLKEGVMQQYSGKITATTARRLLSLRERVPESVGPEDACLELGLDFDEYLQSDDNEAQDTA